MRVLFIASVSQIALVAAAGLAPAQDRSNASPTAAPGVVIEGSSSTSIGGQSAARKGDRTDGGGAIIEGSKDVSMTKARRDHRRQDRLPAASRSAVAAASSSMASPLPASAI